MATSGEGAPPLHTKQLSLIQEASRESLASSRPSPRHHPSVSSLGDVAEEEAQRDSIHPSSSCRHASSVSSRTESVDQMFERGRFRDIGSIESRGSSELIDWEGPEAKDKGALQMRARVKGRDTMASLDECSAGSETMWGQP